MSRPEGNKQFNEESSRFGLPEGYFQRSARSVFNKVEWVDEHKAWPALGSLRDKSVFAVPAGYFARAEQKSELLNYPALAAVGKQAVFAVPRRYFEELEVTELAKIMNDREPDFAIPAKREVFRVRETYFSENTGQLESILLKPDKKGRVIRLFGSGAARFAAAALLTLALGLWTYRIYTAGPETGDCGTIACLDRQELLKSKTLENLETDELYDLVNSKELEKKLENKTGEPLKTKDDSLDDAAMDDLMDEI